MPERSGRFSASLARAVEGSLGFRLPLDKTHFVAQSENAVLQKL